MEIHRWYLEHIPLNLQGLRADQVIYLNSCDGMPAERALEITKDKRMVLVGKYSI